MIGPENDLSARQNQAGSALWRKGRLKTQGEKAGLAAQFAACRREAC